MESLIRSLLRTAKQIRLCMETALAKADSSFARFAVMDALAEEPGLSQRDIGERLSIEGPSITRHLDHLEAEEYVLRQRDRTDRRITRCYLTEAGRHHYNELCPLVAQIEAEAFAQTSPDELLTFAQVLHHLRDSAADVGRGDRPVA